MKSIFLGSMLGLLMMGCSTTSTSSPEKAQSTTSTLFKMTNTPFIGTTLSGQKIKLGGFSGLQFIEEKEGSLMFQTVTDRGPNGELNGVDRPFLLPEFSPTVVFLKVDLATKELSVAAEIKLKKKDGAPLTGLPNTRLEENPTDIFGLYYSVDQQGLDIEGLTPDGEGGWWMADEYAPSLVHFNEEGKLLRRLTPSNELPRMYSERKTNRGFEGVSKVENKLYGILQSPLPKEQPAKDGEFSRIVEVDLETMKTSAEYFYMFEKGNDKIGDMVALNAKNFLVIEQNGKTGEHSQKYIYRITLGESDQLVKKTLIADLKKTPFNNVEKVEGLALIDNKRLAIVYDNDFQINGKTNQATGLTPLNDSVNQLLILEFSESLLGDAAL
jgi:3-phytase